MHNEHTEHIIQTVCKPKNVRTWCKLGANFEKIRISQPGNHNSYFGFDDSNLDYVFWWIHPQASSRAALQECKLFGMIFTLWANWKQACANQMHQHEKLVKKRNWDKLLQCKHVCNMHINAITVLDSRSKPWFFIGGGFAQSVQSLHSLLRPCPPMFDAGS